MKYMETELLKRLKEHPIKDADFYLIDYPSCPLFWAIKKKCDGIFIIYIWDGVSDSFNDIKIMEGYCKI
jgi:hypothetical protein